MPAPEADDLLAELELGDEAGRRLAILALAKAGEIRAIPLLRRVATQDESLELRFLAQKALSLMSASEEDEAPDPEDMEISFPEDEPEDSGPLPGLTSPDPAKRIEALKSAARSGDPLHLPHVLRRIGHEPLPEVRALQALVVAILGGRQQLPVMIQFLKDSDPRVRAQTVEALETLQDPAAIAAIIGTLMDGDTRVRARATRALTRLGRANILRCCEAMLGAEELWMRDSAAFCLAVSRLPGGTPLLVKALKDPHEGVRIKAKRGLAKLADSGDEAAASALREAESIQDAGTESEEVFQRVERLTEKNKIESLASPDVKERRRATRSLMALGGDASQVPELVEKLRTETDETVRAGLIAALGRCAGASVEEVLAGQLEGGTPAIRAAAVEALGRLDSASAKERLTRALQDPDPRVKANAILALKTTAAAESRRALDTMARSYEASHRQMAVFVLASLAETRDRALVETLALDPDPTVATAAKDLLERKSSLWGSVAETNPIGRDVKQFLKKRQEAKDAGRPPPSPSPFAPFPESLPPGPPVTPAASDFSPFPTGPSDFSPFPEAGGHEDPFALPDSLPPPPPKPAAGGFMPFPESMPPPPPRAPVVARDARAAPDPFPLPPPPPERPAPSRVAPEMFMVDPPAGPSVERPKISLNSGVVRTAARQKRAPEPAPPPLDEASTFDDDDFGGLPPPAPGAAAPASRSRVTTPVAIQHDEVEPDPEDDESGAPAPGPPPAHAAKRGPRLSFFGLVAMSQSAFLALAVIGLVGGIAYGGYYWFNLSDPRTSIRGLVQAIRAKDLPEIEKYLQMESLVGSALGAIMATPEAAGRVDEVAKKAGIEASGAQAVEKSARRMLEGLGQSSGGAADRLELSLAWILDQIGAQTDQLDGLESVASAGPEVLASFKIPYSARSSGILLQCRMRWKDDRWQLAAFENYGALLRRVLEREDGT